MIQQLTLERRLPGLFLDDLEDAGYWTRNVTLLTADSIEVGTLTEQERDTIAAHQNVLFTFKVVNQDSLENAIEELDLLIEGIEAEMQERQATLRLLIGE